MPSIGQLPYARSGHRCVRGGTPGRLVAPAAAHRAGTQDHAGVARRARRDGAPLPARRRQPGQRPRRVRRRLGAGQPAHAAGQRCARRAVRPARHRGAARHHAVRHGHLPGSHLLAAPLHPRRRAAHVSCRGPCSRSGCRCRRRRSMWSRPTAPAQQYIDQDFEDYYSNQPSQNFATAGVLQQHPRRLPRVRRRRAALRRHRGAARLERRQRRHGRRSVHPRRAGRQVLGA